MSSVYIRWMIFFSDLASLYLPVHFLSTLFSGIIAITNSNGNSASLWKIPLWIFTSGQLFLPAALFDSPVFHYCLDKLYDFVGYLVHFETVYYPTFAGPYRMPFCSQSTPYLLFRHVLLSLSICWPIHIVALLLLWFPCGILLSFGEQSAAY